MVRLAATLPSIHKTLRARGHLEKDRRRPTHRPVPLSGIEANQSRSQISRVSPQRDVRQRPSGPILASPGLSLGKTVDDPALAAVACSSQENSYQSLPALPDDFETPQHGAGASADQPKKANSMAAARQPAKTDVRAGDAGRRCLFHHARSALGVPLFLAATIQIAASSSEASRL